MQYIIISLFGVGIFLVISSAFASISATKELYQRLAIQAGLTRKPGLDFISAPFSRPSNFILEKLKLREPLQQKLDAIHSKITPLQFLSIKLVLMVGLPALVYILFSANPGTLLVAFLLGFSIPDLWIKRRISQRKQVIARLLPESIDLLGLCMEAGLDFTTALEWIVKKTQPTPLVEEFAFVLEEIKWGKPRAQALKGMAKRYNLPELRSFVQTLVQAERMGTPVVEVFSILSEDTRLQRYHRGERYALKAPIKMLIPLIFCILPVIAIVIGGPILLQFVQGGLFRGF